MPARPLALLLLTLLSAASASEDATGAAYGDRAALSSAIAHHRLRGDRLPARHIAADAAVARHRRFVVHDGIGYGLALGTLVDVEGRGWLPCPATITAYTPRREECDEDPDVTATGTDAFRQAGIAADPRAIAYRTVLRVPGYGEAPVDDTGGAMRQSWERGTVHLDLRIPRRAPDGRWRSEDECVRIAREHGVRQKTVLIAMN
ncbi:MAG TPA: hypothetical protein VEL07_21695 [Planctomycetota bacterium]|nr:hypothetical protein [Planctomycetota bacterium]